MAGSPFEIPIQPGPTYPFNCTASVTGLQAAELGVRTSFIVKARDRYGNARNTGGDSLIAFTICPDGSKAACDIVDGRNGEYYVSYVAQLHGIYKIEVGIQPEGLTSIKNILGSPYEVEVFGKFESSAQMA